MTIRDTVNYYKNNFAKYWEDEKYKWIAVQHFKDHWNVDADDFANMYKEAFSLCYNLLQGGMYYAYKMACDLAKFDPETMRSLFKRLYNEKLPLIERIQPFRDGCNELLNLYKATLSDPEKAKNHYQDLRAICVYLSFEYPEKYYLYKAKMYSSYKKLIGYQEVSQDPDYEVRKYDNFAILCDEVLKVAKEDPELIKMQETAVNGEKDCYADPNLHLMTQTIIYISEGLISETASDQQSQKGAALADEGIEDVHYWIYSPGDGASIWDECYKKGIMAIGWDEIGDLSVYASKDDMKQAMKDKIDPTKPYMNAAHATWQFVHDLKPGDIVYAKKGMHILVGRGVVESAYEYDASRKRYKNTRKVRWTHKGEWPHPGTAAMKTLTDITAYTDYVEQLKAIFENDSINDVDDQESTFEYPVYDAEDFLEEVFMEEDSYDTLVALVETKKNVILQGAPGVGKTFAAKRLAYSMMGVKDPNRVMMVQFHQSYSYEDFIMGFRPSENGFKIKYGSFYEFCKKAEIDSDNKYFFIIDEINRGNLSKIFGELFMLIESDKRGAELQLLYSDEKFSVPENIYIIGMMNTADRSLAMLDYALRRRFAFFDLKPGFDTEGFRKYRMALENDKFDRLVSCVESLNAAIASDESLGEGFCIGHSYFCNLKKVTDKGLSAIVEFELIPLLKEYWFDEPIKVKDWSGNLRNSIK